ncbi:MAG: lactonase family protein [Actinomycetota bacterium]|nr:lactonase family protein [Actinomycetota bacterium]
MTPERRVYITSALAAPGGPSDGVYGFVQDPATGALSPIGPHAAVEGASFVSRDRTGTHLYTCRARPDAGAAAFAVNNDGSLEALGEVRSGAAGACHVCVDDASRFLFTAHYASGHLSVHRLTASGAIAERCDLVLPEGAGPNAERQEHAHAHFCWPIPGTDLVMLVDLGTDTLWSYRVDADTGRLELVAANQAPSGSGPRHLRPFGIGALLVTGELDSTLMAFQFDRTAGTARLVEALPASVRAGAGDNAPSELALSRDGRFCYVANRGPDTVAVFSLEGGSPARVGEVPCGGEIPRHLAVIGDFLYVANQESGSVAVFALGDDGIPQPTGLDVPLERPFCVRALPVAP